MSFRNIFLAIFIGAALIVSALVVNKARPASDLGYASAEFVSASGKCAECHRAETGAVVHQFERSAHNRAGITCLECHVPQDGQEALSHNGFTIATGLTAKNCASCHTTEYDQFVRSRHALPAYAAVNGTANMTAEMIALGERYHPGAVDRSPNALIDLEGLGTRVKGCLTCHNIGRPNEDGSIGTCTECHSRHDTSIALAREAKTCGQCHMGPDHSQLEIYEESKHGILFHAQRDSMRLDANPKSLLVRDMPIPTCATCHMSGLEGMKVTHDTTERLSYWLFAPVSKKRPGFEAGQAEMQDLCTKCHAKSNVDRFYREAEVVLESTNEQVERAKKVIDDLRAEGLLTPEPFDEPIEFLYFDYWHYFGRTAKHGAYMGGADFVQWHGSYELLAKFVELEEMAAQLRRELGDK